MNSWYLLYCKRSEQQRAEQHLKRQGAYCYYPQVTVDKIRRGKRISLLEPLFPNYVFTSFDPEAISYTTIRSTRGIVDFVRQGSSPVKVPFELIKTLMIHEDSDEQRIAYKADFIEGQRVDVISGPYIGSDAIYKEADGELRSILLINLINQQVEISIDSLTLRKR